MQVEKNKIYQMDCFKFISKIEDDLVDLAVVDPPYNMKKADWDSFPSDDAYWKFMHRWIDALIPKIKKDGSLYIFNTPFNSAYTLPYLVSKGLDFQNWITWDKRDGLGAARRRFSNGQETVLFFTKGTKHTFNYDDVRVPYQSTERMEHAKTKGILKNGKRWFPNPDGGLCGEVWHITSQRHKSKVNGRVQKLSHITPKPFNLIERIIKASSNPNDVVFDCFVGSGTTAIVAKKLSRDFLCCDISKIYAKIANERLILEN